ncbi:BREX-1 system phosphatase PglZ type A [Vibrio splendidus]|uniref:BREX-1 system phosphatase PglZ type A n=1 Tax=Vibrio splendidus TaxID=29497 RepID=UPI0006CA5CAC|nr:BREX-1 system phosphatase PglZ type A [Vibrio splendidus]KPM01488.1 hypothetical protein AN167_02950 [Vibrio splendidus]
MQVKQLEQGLEAKFNKAKVVFWYDSATSFSDKINEINLEGVVVLNMADESTLEVKKWILIDNPQQMYLLYFPFEEPKAEDNWLLDISLYSSQFYADQSSMLLNELGIKSMVLREHVKQREGFFSQGRTASLKSRITEEENEESLDLKMISVLAGVEPNFNSILMELFKQQAVLFMGGGNDKPELISQMAKLNLLNSFWRLCEVNFAYVGEDKCVQDLLYKLFCTDFYIHLEVPSSEKSWAVGNMLGSASGRASASAFMLEWRDSKRFCADYEMIERSVSNDLNIEQRCRSYSPASLQGCYTFEAVEQAVIRGLVQNLTNDIDDRDVLVLHTSVVEKIISKRLSGHWSQEKSVYAGIYLALKSAESLFLLRKKFADGFHYHSAKEMFIAYSNELFLFDHHYRLFNQYVDQVQSKNSDILRKIDSDIEALYVDWFLYELGVVWDKLLEQDKAIDGWSKLSPRLQANFFAEQVKQPLTMKAAKRIFIIISDALRYEVAHELMLSINTEKSIKANLKPMLGVLPSYTQLGMAALLPHKSLDYAAGSGVVMADGQSTSGTDSRNKILRSNGAIAVSAKDLSGWTQKYGREFLKDESIVYVYHDTIDAIGDDGATEHKAFEACEQAVEEVTDLVKKAFKLSASRVLVTADHGFLFQQKGLSQPDKTGLGDSPSGAFVDKKRYILGRNMPEHELCWHGNISNTVPSASQSDVEFILPKGASRFHFKGGARFVHGGAMPQEVCVPLLEVQQLRGKKAEQNEKEKVGIITEKTTIRFVNQIEKVRFIQTNAVGDNFIARKVTAVIKDTQGKAVSSEETLLFDATSDSMNERTREAKFKLIGSDFNRDETYQLFVMDTATNTPVEQFPRPVRIDLLDRDDFGF